MLEELGESLARNVNRFGEPLDEDEKAGLIKFDRHGRIKVLNSVGTIATDSVVINIAPKIEPDHLLFLLELGGVFPRLDDGVSELGSAPDLFELVARWFVREATRVLREGLARDYKLVRDDLMAARGRVLPLRTAQLYYGGSLRVASEFEEFDFDTELNRTLKAASRTVVGAAFLPEEVRRQGRRILAHLDGVGDLRPGDLRAMPDRRTSYYANAIMLAKQLLRREGRSLTGNGRKVWTFLIPTPDAVEAGIRNALKPIFRKFGGVAKRSREIEGGKSGSLNPDLVFGADLAIADVKYKLPSSDPGWRRSDLYEVVAFAAGFRTNHAATISFRRPEQTGAPSVKVGDIAVDDLTWVTSPDISAQEALDDLKSQALAWAEGWLPVDEAEAGFQPPIAVPGDGF